MSINEHHEAVGEAVRSVTYALFYDPDVKTATKYVTPKLTVRLTAQQSRHRRSNQRRITTLLSVGAPNYAEREFIRDCKRAGETFPVARVQIKLRRRTRA
jgi:hypothetical protein